MTRGFYRAFEDNFRGSRNIIRRRLYVYLPFIRPLLSHFPSAMAIDLGCGRGEWLELLQDEGFSAKGVDLDQGMLHACRELGLQVEVDDAVTCLQRLPDESQVLVSAFHLAEHITFESLRELFRQAFRVLKPGGLIILETPNPENLVVGASSFYVDPTHRRPIPPQLLRFIHEYTGFKRSKILRLQEDPHILSSYSLSLLDVLNGVSPDYAVIAQKDGPSSIYETLSESFDRSYGVTLEDLATRYQHQLDTRLGEVNVQVENALALASQAQVQAENALALASQAQVQADQFRSQLVSVYTSSSWRVTAPLRGLAHRLRKLKRTNFRRGTKRAIKFILRKAVALINTNPGLKGLVLATSRHLGLTEKLRMIYWRVSVRDSVLYGDIVSRPHELKYLSLHPRAREIYRDLTRCTQLTEEEKS